MAGSDYVSGRKGLFLPMGDRVQQQIGGQFDGQVKSLTANQENRHNILFTQEAALLNNSTSFGGQ